MKHITVAFTSCVIESGSKIISGVYNFPYISITLSHKKKKKRFLFEKGVTGLSGFVINFF